MKKASTNSDLERSLETAAMSDCITDWFGNFFFIILEASAFSYLVYHKPAFISMTLFGDLSLKKRFML